MVLEQELALREWGWIADLLPLGDTLLFVLDSYGPPFVTVVDLSNSSVVDVFGKKGSGPGELEDPQFIAAGQGPPPHIWTYEFNSREMTRYDLLPEPTFRNQVQFRSGMILTDPRWTDNGIVAGGLFRDSGLVVFSDSDLTTVRRFAGQAPHRREAVDARVFWRANEYLMDMSPDRSKLALAFRFAPELQIIDVRTRRVLDRLPTPRPVGTPRTSTAAGRTMFAVQASDLAFHAAVAASDSGVWAAYCGCRGEQVIGLDAPGAHIVQFYHWRRGFQGEFDVQRSISALGSSATGDRLYVGVLHPEPMVVILRRPDAADRRMGG